VDRFPRGFPRLAAFQSSDNDFVVFRSFKRLHARILLELEVEVSQLEKVLDKQDKEDDADDKMWYRISNTTDDTGADPPQRELLARVRAKLKEYGM
jgi:hypothetical protein